jgi:cardiolipin synthase (CMP-forming)
MSERPITLASQITLLRIVLVPVFVVLILEGRYGPALVVAIVASVSDLVDGWVARAFKQRSRLGVAFDPLADKILMTAAYLVLSLCGLLPWWLTALVLLRDGGILLGALFGIMVSGYRPLPPTVAGKASTASQVAAFLAVVAWKAHFLITPPVVETCIYLAGTLTVISGIHYLMLMRQRLVRRAGDQLS